MAEGGKNMDSSTLSRKVIAIAAGEAHTLALTANGYVYSWGRGTFGRLGNGSQVDQHSPVKILFNSTTDEVKIVGISAGAYHSIALADDGSVWSWGYNTYGQLGFDGDHCLVPRRVQIPMSKNGKVCCGGMVSLAIDDLGGLWMWGTISEVEFASTIPVSINFPGHVVVEVACGSGHIVALVNTKSESESYLACYSWGSNNHGQLGLGDTDSRPNPQIVERFSTLEPYQVACGAFHTCVLTYTQRNTKSESICWSNGQLGLGTTQDSSSPEMVNKLPANLLLVSVDCGLFHTSVASSSGNVWSWGMENGLGLCPEASFVETNAGDALSPRLINGPHFPLPVQVACGAAHTVLLADGGYNLWSWGRGRSGVLGNGQDVDFFNPKPVFWPPPEQQTVSNINEKNPEETTDMEKKLSAAMEELTFLGSKLSVMTRYASILHGSIFGRPFDEEKDIPASLQKPGGIFDITKEWEGMLENCDRGKLIRLQMFYRNMLAGVEDKMMKQKIKEMLKEYLHHEESSAGTNH